MKSIGSLLVTTNEKETRYFRVNKETPPNSLDEQDKIIVISKAADIADRKKLVGLLALTLAAILCAITPSLIRAEEGGTGHHLPGSGVFLIGVLPAEPGFTVRVSDWFYAGSAESTRPLSGILQNTAQTNDGIGSIFSAIKNGNAQLPPRVAILASQLQDRVQATDVNLALDSVQNISTITLLYELPWKPLGTRVVTGVSLPFLYVRTTATVEVRGPKQTRSARIQEDDFGFSDMVVTPVILGWSAGYFHWSTGLSIYAPTGQYSPNDLAPLGKNFWTFEPFVAATYLNTKYGQEASLQIAFDANTVNSATDYHSGCQLNIEWLLAQHLPYGFSVGVTGFIYQQVTADSGNGTTGLAGTYAVGPSIGYTWKNKLSVSGQWLYEFDVGNRFQGSVASLVASWTF